MNSRFILIVDDSVTNQVFLDALLKEEGYRTKTAGNAVEAFDILKNDVPQLILLDLLMPRKNGFELLSEIKENDRLKNIPVIVVSAVDEVAYKERCYSMGVDDFFVKPIDIEAFLRTVAKYTNLNQK
ncbi:MAG: response regulator [Bacteroidales bacterium]|nr:response regulator [Bacteroidales bacterium]HPD95796.1 response regulator [Tenuifilaceae bacterium]HRX30992.1 response regulator [Tenuifilaceae bacterium]